MNTEQKEFLETARDLYDKGDTISLFRAVYYCGSEGIPMPEWVWREIGEGVGDYIVCNSQTLDDAFGAKRPKDMRFDKLKKRTQIMQPVMWSLKEFYDKGYPRSDSTYAEVGEIYDIGKELVKQWQAEFEANDPDYFKPSKK
jgi:hypothetical protein